MAIANSPSYEREYKVSTPLFEGPLDLLLQLIEKAELDITKISLAQVTDQYLDHLKRIKEYALPEEVSGFLVIASRLLQIKSESLLPRPALHLPDEVDQGELLARQLILYKRFKELSIQLSERESSNLRSYLRIAPVPKPEPKIAMMDFSLEDLLSAARELFVIDDRPELATVVPPLRITVREKIQLIGSYLLANRRGRFSEILSKRPFRLEIVVTFLALLELIKRNLIRTRQEGLFAEIEFESMESLDKETLSFDLEFGE